jgi:hypothetical protein
MQVEGGMPAVIQRPPRHHWLLSMSYWKRCKVVSECNRLDYPPDRVLYWWGRWLRVFKAL